MTRQGSIQCTIPSLQMLGLDILVRSRSGSVGRLSPDALHGGINLPTLSDQLYRSARWLRIFTATRMDIPTRSLQELLHVSREDAARRLGRI